MINKKLLKFLSYFNNKFKKSKEYYDELERIIHGNIYTKRCLFTWN